MKIRVLKLSNNKSEKDALSSEDILSMHLGYFVRNGGVTYSTDVPIAEKPDYVILTLGNVEEICYLCHVKEWNFEGKGKKIPPKDIFINYSLDKYKNDVNVSWLLLDTMQEIPIDFLDAILSDDKISEYIKTRPNNKKIYKN